MVVSVLMVLMVLSMPAAQNLIEFCLFPLQLFSINSNRWTRRRILCADICYLMTTATWFLSVFLPFGLFRNGFFLSFLLIIFLFVSPMLLPCNGKLKTAHTHIEIAHDLFFVPLCSQPFNDNKFCSFHWMFALKSNKRAVDVHNKYLYCVVD